ncbi:hypothetical protein AKO1_003460, partial [Acrasis kona]
MDQNEINVLKKNGFVVSERKGSKSFADTYLMLFNSHLPVFISLDSILHAWHESFDTLIEQMESDDLYYALDSILETMLSELNVFKLSFSTFSFELQTVILDVDLFLRVAKQLLGNDYDDDDVHHVIVDERQ